MYLYILILFYCYEVLIKEHRYDLIICAIITHIFALNFSARFIVFSWNRNSNHAKNTGILKQQFAATFLHHVLMHVSHPQTVHLI